MLYLASLTSRKLKDDLIQLRRRFLQDMRNRLLQKGALLAGFLLLGQVSSSELIADARTIALSG